MAYIATKRLYVNREYTKIVEEGSPEAAFLLATPGKPVEMELARRLGLVGKAEPKPRPEAPRSPAPPTKAAAATKPADDDTPTSRHPFPKADTP